MKTFEFIITGHRGMDANPAALITAEAEKYASRILIRNEEIEMDSRSLMGLIALKAGEGDHLLVTLDGPDEEKAAEAMRNVLQKALNAD